MKELVDGTIRVSLDIDPQFRDDFFRLFSDIDMPVAIAPLALAAITSMESSASEAEQPKGWKNLGPLAQSAVLVCKEERFQEYVLVQIGGASAPEFFSEEAAADYIKQRCNVASRKDLDITDGAKTRFGALMADYKQWLTRNP